MKIPLDELNKIRSLANDNLRELVKPTIMEPSEFTTYCWVKAISTRLNLNITVEIPTRWKTPTEIK